MAKTHVKMVKMRNTGSNAFHVIPPRPCYPDWRWQKEQGKTGITGPASGFDGIAIAYRIIVFRVNKMRTNRANRKLGTFGRRRVRWIGLQAIREAFFRVRVRVEFSPPISRGLLGRVPPPLRIR